jgi:histidine triad (HIT) family protein
VAEDCLFCKIASRDVDAEIVDEDDDTVAFMDINPWTRGHALVIPRNHSRNLYDIGDEDMAHVLSAAQRLAKQMRNHLGCSGINLFNSSEAAAWQTVFHFHVHVIPRYDDDPLQLPTQPEEADEEQLAEVADQLRA